MLKIATGESDRESVSPLDELVTEGARRMLAAALEAEVADYIDRYLGDVDGDGHRLVVRNGRAAEGMGFPSNRGGLLIDG